MNININRKTATSTLMFGVLAAILMTSASAMFYTPNSAYAANDANGIVLKQPFPNTYTLTYEVQWYESSPGFHENFIDHGTGLVDSIRLTFDDKNADSAMMAGYFKLSNNSCTNSPNERIAVALNGGPHSDNDPNPAGDNTITPTPNRNYADTQWVELDYDGDNSQMRFEKTHNFYSSAFASLNNPADAIPMPTGKNACNTPDGFIGIMVFKTNVDTNCDGTKDRWMVRAYYDISGLDGSGNPQNNWQQYFTKTLVPSSIVPTYIKSWNTPWVKANAAAIQAAGGDSDYREMTFRFDDQDIDDWDDSSTNYKFVTLKRATATTNAC